MSKILDFMICAVWVLSIGGTVYMFWLRNVVDQDLAGTLSFFGVINIMLEIIASPVVVESFNRLK